MPTAVHEKSNYAGKQSKDGRISLFLSCRNIFESTQQHPELYMVLHRDNAQAGNTKVVLSLLARLVIDGGLQFVESTIYQEECILFDAAANERFQVTEDMGDGYYRVRMRMPNGLPDSLTLTPLTSGRMALGYGLTWYVAASLVSPGTVSLDTSLHGKRQSKVVIAFSKTSLLQSNLNSIAAAQSNNNAQLQVKASLNKSGYVLGEDTCMRLCLEYINPQQLKIKGVRINCKQLITLQVGNEGPLRIKNTWLQHDSAVASHLIELPLTGLQSHVAVAGGCYQLALLPRFPRSSMLWELMPSLSYSSVSNDGASLRRSLRSLQVQYYLNIHILLSWSRRNLLLKVPFEIILPKPYAMTDNPSYSPVIMSEPTNVNFLSREEDLRKALSDLILSIQSIERAQLAPISCTRSDEAKMIECAKEMCQELSCARQALISLMQQHLCTASARDLSSHLTKALEAHAQVVFYSGIPRLEREKVLRSALESLNILELLLLAHLRTVADNVLVDLEEEVTGTLIRASNELQQKFLLLTSGFPSLYLALMALTTHASLSNDFKVLLKSDFQSIDIGNSWIFRELLVESGWELGFMPPVNYPPTVKLALQQATTLKDRLDILTNVYY